MTPCKCAMIHICVSWLTYVCHDLHMCAKLYVAALQREYIKLIPLPFLLFPWHDTFVSVPWFTYVRQHICGSSPTGIQQIDAPTLPPVSLPLQPHHALLPPLGLGKNICVEVLECVVSHMYAAYKWGLPHLKRYVAYECIQVCVHVDMCVQMLECGV